MEWREMCVGGISVLITRRGNEGESWQRKEIKMRAQEKVLHSSSGVNKNMAVWRKGGEKVEDSHVIS